MKTYPSIPHYLTRHLLESAPKSLIFFDKLDGSNIRAEWSKNQGWYKFGSRKRLLGEDQVLSEARELVVQEYGEGLEAIFRKRRYESAVAFFEFFGPNSCFGQHRLDEPHKVVLLDVSPYKKGILRPQEFIDLFGHLGIPKVVHEGAIEELAKAVLDGLLEGMTFEGVVGKAWHEKQHRVFMLKLKSKAWYDALKRYREVHGDVGLEDVDGGLF